MRYGKKDNIGDKIVMVETDLNEDTGELEYIDINISLSKDYIMAKGVSGLYNPILDEIKNLERLLVATGYITDKN